MPAAPFCSLPAAGANTPGEAFQPVQEAMQRVLSGCESAELELLVSFMRQLGDAADRLIQHLNTVLTCE